MTPEEYKLSFAEYAIQFCDFIHNRISREKPAFVQADRISRMQLMSFYSISKSLPADEALVEDIWLQPGSDFEAYETQFFQDEVIELARSHAIANWYRKAVYTNANEPDATLASVTDQLVVEGVDMANVVKTLESANQIDQQILWLQDYVANLNQELVI